jgi:hypothetical protein
VPGQPGVHSDAPRPRRPGGPLGQDGAGLPRSPRRRPHGTPRARHSPRVATVPASKSRQSPRPRASNRTLLSPAASSRASSRSPLLRAMGAGPRARSPRRLLALPQLPGLSLDSPSSRPAGLLPGRLGAASRAPPPPPPPPPPRRAAPTRQVRARSRPTRPDPARPGPLGPGAAHPPRRGSCARARVETAAAEAGARARRALPVPRAGAEPGSQPGTEIPHIPRCGGGCQPRGAWGAQNLPRRPPAALYGQPGAAEPCPAGNHRPPTPPPPGLSLDGSLGRCASVSLMGKLRVWLACFVG